MDARQFGFSAPVNRAGAVFEEQNDLRPKVTECG
jgi:hypothetical protein